MIKDTSTEWARQMATSLRDDRCDLAADLLLSIAEERDAAVKDITLITKTAIDEHLECERLEAENKRLRDAWNRLSTTIEVAFSEDGIYGVSSETSLQNVWLACRDLSASLKKEMKS
jgi:hypothetical protein